MTSSDPPDRRRPDPGGAAAEWPAAQERRAPFQGKNIPSPNDAARAGSYARFIPREELGGFAAWQPGDIGGGPPPQANVQRATEEPPRTDVAAQLAARLQTARQAGYQDGYRDGLVALDGFKQSFAMQTTTRIGAVLGSLDAALAELQQDMARSLAVSATHLARQIVRAELRQRPELVGSVAREAVETLLLSARHITLRVHPDDQSFVAQGAAELIASRGARLVADAAVSRGGVLVESDIGVIDATIEARWRRASAALGCDEAWAADDAANAEAVDASALAGPSRSADPLAGSSAGSSAGASADSSAYSSADTSADPPADPPVRADAPTPTSNHDDTTPAPRPASKPAP